MDKDPVAANLGEHVFLGKDTQVPLQILRVNGVERILASLGKEVFSLLGKAQLGVFPGGGVLEKALRFRVHHIDGGEVRGQRGDPAE